MNKAFLIGNGPSLRDMNLSVLANEATFICNGGYLFDWPFTPTYYGINSNKKHHIEPATKALPHTKKFYLKKVEPRGLPRGWSWIPANFGHPMCEYGFAPESSVLPLSRATPLTLAQIAWRMGARDIYLLGNDQTRYGHSYALTGALAERRKEGGLGPLLKEREWIANEQDTRKDFERARLDIEGMGGNIYECTPNGAMIDVLPYIPLEEAV